MTSGKDKKRVEISVAGQVRQEDFSYHHQEPTCDGSWGILIQKNALFPLNALGTALLPMAPFVACPKCKAAYLLPGFQDLVEHTIALKLVVSDRILMPKEIKFLRLMFGLTQQAVIDEIELVSVSYYSKCESGKQGVTLGPDKQVRLKLLYAIKLGIHSAEDYHRINLTSGKRDQVEPGVLIELRPNPEAVEKLKADFKSQFHVQELSPVKEG